MLLAGTKGQRLATSLNYCNTRANCLYLFCLLKLKLKAVSIEPRGPLSSNFNIGIARYDTFRVLPYR